MDRTEKTTLTNMCMIVQNDEVLTINRVDKTWGGIAFPGGHVEKHESFQKSVIREVKEETNLDIINPELIGVKQFFDKNDYRYIVFFYRADHFTGKVKSSREGQLEWVKISDLKNQNLAYNFEQDLKLFLNSNLHEHFLMGNHDELY